MAVIFPRYWDYIILSYNNQIAFSARGIYVCKLFESLGPSLNFISRVNNMLSIKMYKEKLAVAKFQSLIIRSATPEFIIPPRKTQ